MPQGNIVETTTLPMISESIEDKNKVVSVAIEDKDIQKMSTK
jgi:hypothetical protein